jgi:hypothetical protein
VLLQLGAPPARTTSNLGSPGSTPGTPLATNSPSPLGPGAAMAASPAVGAIPPTTPEQVFIRNDVKTPVVKLCESFQG